MNLYCNNCVKIWFWWVGPTLYVNARTIRSASLCKGVGSFDHSDFDRN